MVKMTYEAKNSKTCSALACPDKHNSVAPLSPSNRFDSWLNKQARASKAMVRYDCDSQRYDHSTTYVTTVSLAYLCVGCCTKA